jgi:hypothetical protein
MIVSSFSKKFSAPKRRGKAFRKSIFNTMMNALGSAGLLDNIVNAFPFKVKDRSA